MNKGGIHAGDVEVAPLRARFLVLHRTDSLSTADVAERLDWRLASGRPDCRRAGKALGLHKDYSRGRGRLRTRVRYETAVKLADALGMDPHEAGV